MANDTYIPAEEAAGILGLSKRQTFRYAEGPQPRIRTEYVNGRKLFHKGDAEAAAEERRSAGTPPQKRGTDLVPIGEMLEYLQDTQDKLNRAMLEIGRLQGQLEAAQERIRQLEGPKPEPEPAPAQPIEEHMPVWKRLLLRLMT